MDIGTLPFTSGQTVADIGGADLSTHMGLVSSRGGMNVQFFYQRAEIESIDAGISYQNRLCVVKQPKGDRLTVYVGFISEQEAAKRWPAEWAAFRHSESIPTTGTPLAELPGITQQQVGLLLVHGLRSIEDLAECDRSVVQQVGLVASKAQQMAQAWLTRKNENLALLEVSEVKALADQRAREMQRQLDDMKQLVLEANAQIKALTQMGGMVQVGINARGPSDPIPVKDDPLPERAVLASDAATDGYDGIVTGSDDLMGGDLP